MVELGLKGKRVLIAGAGRGIGRACCLLFAALGARLACLDADGERRESVVEELRRAGSEAIPLAADVRSPEAVESAVAHTVEALGGVDVCVDVIGVSSRRWDKPCAEISKVGEAYASAASASSIARRRWTAQRPMVVSTR